MQEGEKEESKQLIRTRKGKINQGGSVEKEHPECPWTKGMSSNVLCLAP